MQNYKKKLIYTIGINLPKNENACSPLFPKKYTLTVCTNFDGLLACTLLEGCCWVVHNESVYPYTSNYRKCKCASPYKKIRSLQIESGFLIWFHRITSRAYYADARAERPYYSEFRISFTLSEMARPSALPASCLLATPITLPISLGDVAPTCSMIALTATVSSASDIICGRYLL